MKDVYKYRIFINDFLPEDDSIIFFSQERNAICRMNYKGVTKKIAEFPNEYDLMLMYSGMCRIEKGVYLFAPKTAHKNDLVIYNECDNRFDYVTMSEEVRKKFSMASNKSFRFGNNLYMVSWTLQMLCLDVERMCIREIGFPDAQYESDLIGECVCVNNIVYIPMRFRNVIYAFNMEEESFEQIELEGRIKGINTLAFYDGWLWMTGNFQGVYGIHLQSGDSRAYMDLPDGFYLNVETKGLNRGREFQFSSIYGKNKLILLPGFGNMTVKIHIDNGKVQEIKIPNEEENNESLFRQGRFSSVKYGQLKRKDHKYYFSSFKNKCLYSFDTKTEEVECIDPVWYGNERPRIKIWVDNFLVMENQQDGIDTDLESYLNTDYVTKRKNKWENIGTDIFQLSKMS